MSGFILSNIYSECIYWVSIVPWLIFYQGHRKRLWVQSPADRLTVSLVSQHENSTPRRVTDDCLILQTWTEVLLQPRAGCRGKQSQSGWSLQRQQGHWRWWPLRISEWNSFSPLALYCGSLIAKVPQPVCHWWTLSHVTDARCLLREDAWTGERSWRRRQNDRRVLLDYLGG